MIATPTSETLTSGARPSEVATPASSAVSWGAIFAGAAGAAALSLILLILGTGLGLSSASPWADRGADAATLGYSSIAWLTLTQLAAAGMGGYLAGRLRSKWVQTHSDEVYFRDTAHGFLAWAVATLVTAAVLTSAIGSIVGTGAKAGAAVAGGAVTAATGAGAGAAVASGSGAGPDMGYFLDTMFRKDPGAAASPDQGTGPSMAEVTRIFANDLRAGSMTQDDTKYVGQLVAQRTGLSQADAEKRVSDAYAKVKAQLQAAETAARDAADKTRKAAAATSLWLFITLLIGAFAASYAATHGGRRANPYVLTSTRP